MKKFVFVAALLCLMSAFADNYFICVGSFLNEKNAVSLAEKLKNEEKDVCISEYVAKDGKNSSASF